MDAGALDFGRYRVIRPIGRGGMGEVYLATDATLRRQVAIKLVAPDRLTQPDARRRLLDEARAAARLDHPCICAVHEVGETPGGRPFIVMQHVEGEPLSTTLERGPLGVRQALEIGLKLADALATAHRHHIVHRDLKPGNVIVTRSGEPKLVDFGIAKVVASPAALADATTMSRDVGVGTSVRGTPAYMSPEQVLQRQVDPRSDLFSLGAVLYECLTGRRAFEGPTVVETLAAIIQAEPPAPSTLRPELHEGHDELCRRLLAKEPADRFESAEQVIGAIRLLIDGPAPAPPGRSSRRHAIAALIALACSGSAGAWWVTREAPLPDAPADADRWYTRGTEAIREGAYFTGRTALEEAVTLFPQHALAYARLAEASAELDDQHAAENALVRVSALVPDASRLPKSERLRLQAVRALVLRDPDAAIAAYGELTETAPGDARGWLDLGRAQETAERREEARASYRRAIAEDGQYAAAYLRLGMIEAQEGRLSEAMAAFREAERLYRTAMNIEGETEVLLRRTATNDAAGLLKEARADLDRALSLAGSSQAPYQELRAQLTLSSVTASEGHFAEAARIAEGALEKAEATGLETVAAEGLIDLAASLADAGRYGEARQHVERALALAEARSAPRIAARGRLQLASIYESENRSEEALAVLDSVLPYVKANRYRRFELLGLSIGALAHARLDRLALSRQMSADVLALAETLNDRPRIALAAAGLAAVSTTIGDYPAALRHRDRAIELRRQLGDRAALPYDLSNRADVLLRLGRRDEAALALHELEKGAEAGIDAYRRVSRRVPFLRAFAAATALDCAEALRQVERIPPADHQSDSARAIGPAIETYCAARLRRRLRTEPPDPALPSQVREQQYWLAAAALERGDASSARERVARTLPGVVRVGHHELTWRLAAVGAIAASRSGDRKAAEELAARAREALAALRAGWGEAFESYGMRADVVELRRRVRLD